MVDFDKKVYNSDKFRQAALYFERHGYYCPYPTGTTEYLKYWDEEKRRSLDGYTAEDGDWISGYYYFYLNYCPIDTVTEVEKIDRFGKVIKKRVHERNFPSFYDYDFYFFWAVQEAEDANKHLCVLKSRRKGYSYKCSSMLCRNYFLISESKSYAYANGDQYLTKDGILSKAWDCMAFIDDNTAWAKKRQKIDTTMHKRSSLVVTDEVGNKVEVGYKSEIIGVTIKSDPDKVRGKAGNLFLFEEAGKNPVLLDAWEIVRPSAEQDGVAHALIIAFGTGGSGTNDFAGLQEMFYNPDSFNCLAFDNIWDDNATGSKCGFFIPQYANLDIKDENGNRLYMDKDGNTLKEAAYESEMRRRKPLLDNAKSSATIDRFVAENCLTPAEACLELSGNIFPKKLLQQQLSLIRSNTKLQNHKQIGDLNFVNGELVWTNKKQGDIIKYPLGKNDDPTGSIVIWEHPTPNAPHGLYIGGCDPYDHDQAGTNSLGSTFIYKRFQNFEEYYDIIVAEYTGRPETAEDYYENVRKLLLYYNARLLYENERKGIFPYFTQKHCDHLLAEQPDIISDIIGNSKVQRRKGIHMTKQIRAYGEGLIKEWLNEEFAPGRKNLTRILSEPLLEELIKCNEKTNVDRVIALIMVMIYREQLYNNKIKDAEDNTRRQSLFDEPLFGSNNDYDIFRSTDNTPTFTF